MKNTLVAIVVLAIIGLGAYVYIQNNNKATEVVEDETLIENTSPLPDSTADDTMVDDAMMSEDKMTESPAMEEDETANTSMNKVREFTVVGTPFKFDVSEIKVKKGETVRITFKNGGGFHDWVLDEFNVRTKQIQADQMETIEFVADKTGTFEYYCSVGNHRQMGMVGKLIVE